MNMMDESSEFQAYLNEDKNNNKKNNKFWVYIIIAIVVIIVLISTHRLLKIFSVKEDDFNDMYARGISEELFIKSLKEGNNLDTPSDIEGMSIGEKMELGLVSQFGSDTDYDGLTDKEEIEIYNSDPLKASTSGDLYTDKYKIEHSLDINTYYEYEGESKFNPKDVPIFTLDAVTPLDFYAKVIDSTGNLDDYMEYESSRKIDYSKVQKIYTITNYSNNVFEIDLSELNDKDVDIKVFENMCDTPISDTKVKTNGDVAIVTLKNAMQPKNNYMVFISNGVKEKLGIISTFNDYVEEKFEEYELENEEVLRLYDAYSKSIIISYPIYTCLTGTPPTVLISKTATEEEFADTLKMANILYEESRPLLGFYVDKRTVTKKDCTMVTEGEIMRRFLLNYYTWGPEYVYFGVMPDRLFLHCYSPYGAYADDLHEQQEIIKENNRKFIASDRFCFENFRTNFYMDNHGNCAGFALIVARVHDKEGLDSLSGSYYSTAFNCEVSYEMDINAEENQTLLDRYLSDYKSGRFGGIRALKSKDSNEYKELPNFDNMEITDDEYEFTKMMSAYWAEYNDNLMKYDVAITGFLSNKHHMYLDWKTIENMKSALDSKKTLIWGFNINNKYLNGHAVNLTGYREYGEGIDKTVIFDVYDNNYPDLTFELKCKKIVSSLGHESFEYIYETNYGDKYTSSFDFNDNTQIKGIRDDYVEGDVLHTFYVFDSELNNLNVPIEF